MRRYYEAAIWTGFRLNRAQWRTTCDAIAFAYWVGCAAIFASDSVQPRGKFMARTRRLYSLIDDAPNMLAELQILNILGNIIEAADQA